jgi:hypothetical protein
MMIEREWKRQLNDADFLPRVSESVRPSPRASVVLVFWSYFETRIDRLLQTTTRGLPVGVRKELLKRHSQIGARLVRLYRVLFETTYWSDLRTLGFGQVADLLQLIQQERNKFVHGHPEAISHELVDQLVASLREEHEAWIAVFNLRVSKMIKPI